MDTRDGRIYTPEEMEKLFGKVMIVDDGRAYRRLMEGIRKVGDKDQLQYFKPMEVPPTRQQMTRNPPSVGRNEPCPCGSGKKFKKCCLVKNWRERFGLGSNSDSTESK